MNSIPENNEMHLELMLGLIQHVSVESGVCLIQPVSDTITRKGDTAIPGDFGGRTSVAAVRDATIYRVHDHVLYVRTAVQGFHGSSIMDTAVILCRVPFAICEYTDKPKINEDKTGDAHDYYDSLAKTLGREYDDESATDAPTARFIDSDWLEMKIGGDKVFEGRNVILRVSDETIQILGRNCGIHINSTDSSISGHGITWEFCVLGNDRRSLLINDTITQLDRRTGGTKRTLDPETELETFEQETVYGDIAYGEVNTLFGGTIPLRQIQNRSDGGYKLQTVTGILFEKTTNISGSRPLVPRSIMFDPDMEYADKIKPEFKQLTEVGREPFDRVTESELWETFPFKDDSAASDYADEDEREYLREPGDCADADGPKVSDVEGQEMKTFKGKATWGVLPNGGFVIRDAWGSEIRMCDGDIQIAAARDILYICGKDMLGVAGAVASLQSGDSIQLGVSRGGLDMHAKTDVNIHGGSTVNIYGQTAASVVSDTSAQLSGGTTGEAIIAGSNVWLSGANEIGIAGTRTSITGRSEVQLATPSSALGITAAAIVAGAGSVTILGELATGKSSYMPGTINDIDVKCGSGTGSMSILGNLVVGETVGVNGDLVVSGAGAFKALASADSKPVEGGLGFGSSTKAPKKSSINDPKIPEAGKSKVKFSDIMAAVRSGISGALATMFLPSRMELNWLVPLFSGEYKNTTSLSDPSRVDIDGKSRYIYPGENFWMKGGLTPTENRKEALNILYEKTGKASSVKATELQLSKLEE